MTVFIMHQKRQVALAPRGPSRITYRLIGHFGDVLPSQSFDVVLNNLNPTRQKQTTLEQTNLS